ncbi:MAG TPA: hypothetical protein VFY29_19520 [Terriglobia bacterium]|nr:hypothetical protein [Terriglobia bacterium]
MEEAIASHERNSNAGRFKVVDLGAHGFSIVMNALADKTGKIKPVKPALDTLVSFTEKDRTLGETLELISQAVAEAGATPFHIGGPGSEDFLERTRIKMGAQNEPGRTILAKALRLSGDNLWAWTLSTLPDGLRVLALRPVEIEVDDAGHVGLQRMTAPR